MSSIFNVNTNEQINAHNGPALIFFAPWGTTFPTDASDVLNLTGASQWQPKTGWTCLGATKTGIKIERGFTKVDRTSDQSFGPFDSRPNQWTASVTSELLETNLIGLRLAWEGSPVFTDAAPILTTLSAGVSVGGTTAVLTAPGALASGDLLIVDTGTGQEWHTVALVSGSTATFAGGESYEFAHCSGALALVPGKQHLNFGRPRSLVPRVLAVVAPLVTLNNTAHGNVDLLRMWAFRRTTLTEGNKTTNLTQENDWVLPVGFHAYRDTTVGETQDIFTVVDLTVANVSQSC